MLKQKLPKVLSLFAALVLIAVLIPLPASAAAFTPRTTRPDSSNRYYIVRGAGGLNECIAGNGGYPSALPNCVGYAWGRAYEISGTRPRLSKGNASTFWGYGDGYARGQEPKLGAIICWGRNGGNHVAVVEKIEGNNVSYSESNWTPANGIFNYKTKTKAAIKDSSFQGYIYIGDFSPVTKPTGPWMKQSKADAQYAVGEAVTLTYGAQGATGYNLGIDREGVRISTPKMGGTAAYTASFDTPGSYTAYASCINSAGYVDTARVSFNVYAVNLGAYRPEGEFQIAGGILGGITAGRGGAVGAGMRAGELKILFAVPAASLRVELFSADGAARIENNAVPVATGMRLRLVKTAGGGTADELNIAVKGDILGSGRCSIAGFARMAQAVRGRAPLTGAYLAAGDFNGDGRATISDFASFAALLRG